MGILRRQLWKKFLESSMTSTDLLVSKLMVCEKIQGKSVEIEKGKV